jgi:hypothetical protein
VVTIGFISIYRTMATSGSPSIEIIAWTSAARYRASRLAW